MTASSSSLLSNELDNQLDLKRSRIADEDDESKSKSKRHCASKPISSYFLQSPMIEKIPQVFVAKYIPGKPIPPSPSGRNILIHIDPKRLGGQLSPYQIKDENGCLLENIWQFSKVYARVDKQRTPKSRYQPQDIIWEHPSEQHVDPISNEILPDYWKWREKGTYNNYAVRYPNGFHGRTQCLYALWPIPENDKTTPYAAIDPNGIKYMKLDYIQARKVIYCGLYARLSIQHPEFLKIKQMFNNGEHIQIVEVDGPKPEWYNNTPISDSFIRQSLIINKKTIEYLVNDPSHPFGHGYVIATLLMDGLSWIN